MPHMIGEKQYSRAWKSDGSRYRGLLGNYQGSLVQPESVPAGAGDEVDNQIISPNGIDQLTGQCHFLVIARAIDRTGFITPISRFSIQQLQRVTSAPIGYMNQVYTVPALNQITMTCDVAEQSLQPARNPTAI
jgi:hypothetical protein